MQKGSSGAFLTPKPDGNKVNMDNQKVYGQTPAFSDTPEQISNAFSTANQLKSNLLSVKICVNKNPFIFVSQNFFWRLVTFRLEQPVFTTTV